MTKRNQSIVDRYNRSDEYELYQAYSSMSRKKVEAWEDCKKLCYKKTGTGLKIISHNSYQFTAGFTYEENGKKYLMYITKCGDEPILLED